MEATVAMPRRYTNEWAKPLMNINTCRMSSDRKELLYCSVMFSYHNLGGCGHKPLSSDWVPCIDHSPVGLEDIQVNKKRQYSYLWHSILHRSHRLTVHSPLFGLSPFYTSVDHSPVGLEDIQEKTSILISMAFTSLLTVHSPIGPLCWPTTNQIVVLSSHQDKRHSIPKWLKPSHEYCNNTTQRARVFQTDPCWTKYYQNYPSSRPPNIGLLRLTCWDTSGRHLGGVWGVGNTWRHLGGIWEGCGGLRGQGSVSREIIQSIFVFLSKVARATFSPARERIDHQDLRLHTKVGVRRGRGSTPIGLWISYLTARTPTVSTVCGIYIFVELWN